MISKEKVQELIKRAYSIAATHGFHEVDRSNAHFMMLVVSEIGEMVEADRKGRRAFVGDKLSISDETFAEWFESNIKDTLEDELADVCIRIFDFCGLRRFVPTMSSTGVIDMDAEFDRIFGNMSICEQCYSLCNLLMDVTRFASPDEKQRALGSVLSFAVSFARRHGIDLEWHVENKLRYNESRERLHGKKY